MAKDSMDKLGYSESQARARAALPAGAYSEEGRKEGAFEQEWLGGPGVGVGTG